MTKQDFELLAQACAEILVSQGHKPNSKANLFSIVTGTISDACSDSNERFKRNKFKDTVREEMRSML